MTTDKPDTYKLVTERIVNALNEGPAAWTKCWTSFGKGGNPINGLSGRAYRGINVLLLALAGNGDSRWYTFDQAMQAVGYRKNPEWKGKADTFKGVKKWIWTKGGDDPKLGVKKGEKGTQVVFWRSFEKETKEIDPKTGEKKKTRIFTCRLYTVFNATQIAGLPDAPPVVNPNEGFESVAARFETFGATINHGGDRAYYSPVEDRIQMPEPGQFEEISRYWATLAHEYTHWTGAKPRCDRDLTGRFGSESYAMEELVAEIGSAFLCARLGIEGEMRHPEYINSWIKKLGEDKYAVFTAARLAAEAVDFLLGTDTAKEDEDSEESEDSEAA